MREQRQHGAADLAGRGIVPADQQVGDHRRGFFAGQSVAILFRRDQRGHQIVAWRIVLSVAQFERIAKDSGNRGRCRRPPRKFGSCRFPPGLRSNPEVVESIVTPDGGNGATIFAVVSGGEGSPI